MAVIFLNPFVGNFGSGGGGGGDALAAHQYWRINITANESGSDSFVRELTFLTGLDDASTQNTGGTASASSEDGANVAANAFDGGSSAWRNDPVESLPHQLEYDFGSAVTVRGVRIEGSLNNSTNSVNIKDFDVQYSDDGSSWTTAFSVSKPAGRGDVRYHYNDTDLTQQMTNGDFETSDKTGWTDGTLGASFVVRTAANSGNSDAPYEGTYLLDSGSAADKDIYQDIDVTSFASAIASGDLKYAGTLEGINWSTDGDRAGIEIEFYDDTMTIIGSSDKATTSSQEWDQVQVRGVVPTTTETIRVKAIAERVSGGTANIACDKVTFYIDDES